MSEAEEISVLRKMLAQPVPVQADVPLTASRAVRLAVTRAAEQGVGLFLSVQSVAEEAASLDDMVQMIAPQHGLLQLTRRGKGPPYAADDIVGYAGLDRQFANAVVELQTTGRVRALAPEDRPLTSADLSLSHPFLVALFSQMDETTERTTLDGWTAGVAPAARFEDSRALGLTLDDVTYRIMRVTVDLGVEGRTGEFIIALPLPEVDTSSVPKPKQVDWAAALEDAVMAAPAALRAILHRFDVPLRVADGFHVGQVVPLAGCTVGSVELEGPSGELFARARLGQVAGHIAIRIEAPNVQMVDGLPYVPNLNHDDGDIPKAPPKPIANEPHPLIDVPAEV